MVDVETGTTDLDMDVAQILRKANKPVFIAVNKVDNAMRMDDTMEFYNLGLGDYFPISSINGSGTGDLLDAVVDCFSKEDEPKTYELPKFAIVGRPNAGKSSLVNALMENNNIGPALQELHVILLTLTIINLVMITLVDTAGLRRKLRFMKILVLLCYENH